MPWVGVEPLCLIQSVLSVWSCVKLQNGWLLWLKSQEINVPTERQTQHIQISDAKRRHCWLCCVSVVHDETGCKFGRHFYKSRLKYIPCQKWLFYIAGQRFFPNEKFIRGLLIVCLTPLLRQISRCNHHFSCTTNLEKKNPSKLNGKVIFKWSTWKHIR